MPQPRVWLIPVIFVVVLLPLAWVCDRVSAAIGAPTHYLPTLLWVFGGLVALAVLLASREIQRVRVAGPPARTPTPDEWEAMQERARVREEGRARAERLARQEQGRSATVTVTEVRDIPKPVAADASQLYPIPDLDEVADAEVVDDVEGVR